MVNGNSNEPPLSMAGVQGFPRRAADAVAPLHYAEIVMQPDRRKLAQSFVIPARTGKAFDLPAGQVVRVTCVEGPQVADMIVFNADDRAEKFWSDARADPWGSSAGG